MRFSRFAILAVLILSVGLSACGRRGALEPPPGAEEREDEPFILDPLI